jgi:hypothetical protein
LFCVHVVHRWGLTARRANHGVASRQAIIGQVLGIVYRCIATHLVKKAGFSCKTAQTGAVTVIQRFGSALNLNIHFYMLFLDGGVCRAT